MQEEKNVKENQEKKRGRPKTGQKKLKTVGFRIPEDTYERYEQLAQEKAGVSIHTFVKENIDFLFKRETKNKKRNLYYEADQELERKIKAMNKYFFDIDIDYFVKSEVTLYEAEIINCDLEDFLATQTIVDEKLKKQMLLFYGIITMGYNNKVNTLMTTNRITQDLKDFLEGWGEILPEQIKEKIKCVIEINEK